MRRTAHKYALLLALFLVIQVASGMIAREKRDASDSNSGSGSGSNSGSSSNSNSGSGSSEDSSGDSDDDGMMASVKDMALYMPLIGGMTVSGIESLEYGWMRANQLTDGAIGRILGGTLPCTIYMDGISCTGVTTTSDLATMVESMLDPIPGLMLPSFVKAFIVFLVDVSWSPTMDVLFGGVSRS